MDDAVAKGATVLTGGRAPDRPGWFYPPTVVTDLTPDMRMYGEEVFGPVAGLYRVESLDEALDVANATKYGLGSNAWTTDPAERERFVAGLDAGQVFVNGMTTSLSRAAVRRRAATPATAANWPTSASASSATPRRSGWVDDRRILFAELSLQIGTVRRMADRIITEVDELKAVTHPLRVRMLGALRADGPATATELARRFDTDTGHDQLPPAQAGPTTSSSKRPSSATDASGAGRPATRRPPGIARRWRPPPRAGPRCRSCAGTSWRSSNATVSAYEAARGRPAAGVGGRRRA